MAKNPRRGPNGGPRPGAGRPKGSKNDLRLGEIRAVKAMRFRVPADVSEPVGKVADRAFQRLVDVMEARVYHKHANTTLQAATRLREEICGPVKQKIEHSGDAEAPLQIVIKEEKDEDT